MTPEWYNERDFRNESIVYGLIKQTKYTSVYELMPIEDVQGYFITYSDIGYCTSNFKRIIHDNVEAYKEIDRIKNLLLDSKKKSINIEESDLYDDEILNDYSFKIHLKEDGLVINLKKNTIEVKPKSRSFTSPEKLVNRRVCTKMFNDLYENKLTFIRLEGSFNRTKYMKQFELSTKIIKAFVNVKDVSDLCDAIIDRIENNPIDYKFSPDPHKIFKKVETHANRLIVKKQILKVFKTPSLLSKNKRNTPK